MKSKVLSQIASLLVTAALAACGGGGGGGSTTTDPQAVTGGTTPQGQTASQPTTTPPTTPTTPTTPVQYALTTTVSGTGSGSVTSSPAGVSCASGGSSCSNNFDAATALTLTANVVTGSQFIGWGGACSGTAATCAVTLSAAKSVTATFDLIPVVTTQNLTVNVSGSGSVVSAANGINCTTSTCTKAINTGTAVTLTATPASGWVFSGWSGACTGTATCSTTLSQARTLTATFVVSTAGGCVIPRGTGTSPVFAGSHPKVFVNHAATLSCLQQMVVNKTASAVRFKDYVDTELASPGSGWEFQYWSAALMYQVTGLTKYADFAIAKIDAFVAGEEAKIAAGQTPDVAGDSYLEVGRLVGDVALVYDWCYARMTASQRTRWIAYMNQSVWNVWNYNSAKWGNKVTPWSGWSVDDPSDNYYYSFLRATMLVGLATKGENASAQGWIDQFRTTKIANQLLPEFNRDLVGGGSREGTGYGNAMRGLFEIYDWWERSTGERIATLTPHTLASTAWMAHNIVPTLDALNATGDHSRDSSAALFDYHREYLLSLISLFPQERMSGAAKILLDNSSMPTVDHDWGYFVDYLYQPPALPATLISDLSPTYWGSGTGHLLMRSAWGDKTAAYSSLMCGPFTQSHAHRDQGAFQLFRGEWLAPTGNIFTASGIEQQEELNNLVRIELSGSTIKQVNGAAPCNLVALADNTTYTYGVAKVTPVYNGNAAISKVEREYLFIKPSTFVVFDRVGSASGTKRIWTLNLPGAPVISGDRLSYTGAKSNKLDVFRVAPTGLSYVASKPVMVESGDSLTNANAKRIDVVDTAGTQSNFLHVMGTNSSVTSAVRSDATGQTGVQIVLADGRTVIVRFGNATTGGTLDIKSAAGASLVTGTLPTTVTTPPLFRN